MEVNGVSDNLLVFVENNDDVDMLIGDILFGGNFYVEIVVMVVDMLVIVLFEIGVLLECRMLLMIDMYLSGLLLFLVENGGVNLGFMIV